MKQVLLGFIMLVMLTPSLVCAMTYCPMQADASVQMPCHETSDNGAATLMLGADCMGVDLMLQDPPDYMPIAQLSDAPDYPPLDMVGAHHFILQNPNIIRGPPINASPPHNAQYNTALILTTQRFRI